MAREPVVAEKLVRLVQRTDKSVKPLDRLRAVQSAVVEAAKHRPEVRELGGSARMVSIRGSSKGLLMTYAMGGRTVVIETTRKLMKQAAARGELDAFVADLVAKAL